MVIKVLGAGCASCKKLDALARQVVTELGAPATVEYVTDFKEIMAHRVLSTPALVIDEKLVCAGRIPSKAELSTWITSALAKPG